jgi:hypothetical protein
MSSEDLVRGPVKERPAVLMREPDGTTLEQLIGELQSNWGVPEFPQEFRITVKVAEDRESRGERTVELAEDLQDPEESPPPEDEGRPRREKAPAAPRIGTGGTEREQAPAGRRRGRRRRRGGRGKGGPAPPS